MRLTHGGRRPFCLDGRTLAARFEHCNKNTIYRIVHRLEAKGWLVRCGGGEQNKRTGKFDSTTYRVLSHAQWAKSHPHACSPVPESGQVSEDQPSKLHPNDGSPVPESGLDLSRFEQKPVPESGHSSISTSVLETSVEQKQDRAPENGALSFFEPLTQQPEQDQRQPQEQVQPLPGEGPKQEIEPTAEMIFAIYPNQRGSFPLHDVRIALAKVKAAGLSGTWLQDRVRDYLKHTPTLVPFFSVWARRNLDPLIEAATAQERFGEIAASTVQDQAASVAEKHDGGSDSHEYELDRARLKIHPAKSNQAESAATNAGGEPHAAKKVVGL
jgi:hypothetical protein